MTIIKHYWYRAAGVAPNFGDELGNEILKKMGYETEWAPPEEAELITTGTILPHLKRKFKDGLQVWGSGASHDNDPMPRAFAEQLDILALRGEITERWLGIEEGSSVLGDPGYLAPLFYEASEKEYDYGFVRQEYDQARHDNLPNGTHVIYATGMPEQVIAEITKCRFIFSSSMHGLIIAQAYGIPCHYIPSSRSILNDKYFDYSTLAADDLKAIQDRLLTAAKRIGKPRPKNAKKVRWANLDDQNKKKEAARNQRTPIFVTFYYDQEGDYYKSSALRGQEVLLKGGAIQLQWGDTVHEDNEGKSHSLVINLHTDLAELTDLFGTEYGGITKLKPFIIDAVRKRYARPVMWWDCDCRIVCMPKINSGSNHKIKFQANREMILSDMSHYWPITDAADLMLESWQDFLSNAKFACGDHTGLRVISADHKYDLVKMSWVSDGHSRTDSKNKDMHNFHNEWKEKGYKYNAE